MISRLPLDTRLFLVAVGGTLAPDITDLSRAACYPAQGLMLRPAGSLEPAPELFIAADDLVGFADLAAVSVLKPVVVPIELAEIVPGRINARLHGDRQVQELAQRFLAAMTASPNPALPAGVPPVSNERKDNDERS